MADCVKGPRPLHRMSRADFAACVLACYSGAPMTRPRIPARVNTCTATEAARATCDELAYSYRIRPHSWGCTLNRPPDHIAPVLVEGEDGAMKPACPYQHVGTRPGVSQPCPSDPVRLERFAPDAIAWVLSTVTLLACEDSPMGRVALAVTSDEWAAVDRECDVRWLHSQPHMSHDERTNRWREAAQRRLFAYLQRRARHPRIRTEGTSWERPYTARVRGAKPDPTRSPANAASPVYPPRPAAPATERATNTTATSTTSAEPATAPA